MAASYGLVAIGTGTAAKVVVSVASMLEISPLLLSGLYLRTRGRFS